MNLIVARPNGLYCPPGDFYIDPWRPVESAVITHGHSDHSRTGHARYLAHDASAGIMRTRLGEISLQTLPYGKEVSQNGVKISFHPAGHVLGSAQVRVEYGGDVWVASGDYKLEHDGTCEPFEPVRWHTFITKATFGLPIYRWPSQPELVLAPPSAQGTPWIRRFAIFRYSLACSFPPLGEGGDGGFGLQLGNLCSSRAQAPIPAFPQRGKEENRETGRCSRLVRPSRLEGDCRRPFGFAACHHRRWQDLRRLARRSNGF